MNIYNNTNIIKTYCMWVIKNYYVIIIFYNQKFEIILYVIVGVLKYESRNQ